MQIELWLAMAINKLRTVLVILFSSCALSSCDLHEVCITPDGGIPESFCEVSKLERFCLHANDIPDNVNVTFLSGTHSLDVPCEIKNASNITLSAQSGSRVVVECSPHGNSGFRFLGVSGLKISGIEFLGCGAALRFPEDLQAADIDPFLHTHGLTVLLFACGSDLTLANITISDSNATGIYLYDIAGNIAVDSCKIKNVSSIMSGTVIAYDHLVSATDIRVTITNSLWLNNTLLEAEGQLGLFSGGLSLYLENSKVTVDIMNTNFSQNTGHDICLEEEIWL